MASRSPSPSPANSLCGFAATIDYIGEDLLQNIISRLPASSFASAACVSRSWNLVCDRILCRPKLSSAVSLNSSLQVAVEESLNKVLSEPIRPHFAIASIGPAFDLHQAYQLIIAKLSSKVPVITNIPSGIIGRDAVSDQFKEIQWEISEEEEDDVEFPLLPSENANRAIMLVVGFVPGLKVKAIPLLKQVEEPQLLMIEKFLMDIREYSASISGCRSPAAIMMFNDWNTSMKHVMEKMDYAMSPDTVIVGDNGCQFLHGNNCFKNATTAAEHVSAAVALVFVRDKDKLPGIGKIQFKAILSSGLSPIGPTYKAASVRERQNDSLTWLTARREGFHENIDGETILSQVYDELGDRIQFPTFYIGVTKRRKCSIGQDKVGWMTSQTFHEVLGDNQEYLFVGDIGIKTGDPFRFYHSDSTTALSSRANVSDLLRCFNQASTSNTNTERDKTDVFGGLIFTCCGRGKSFFGQPNVDSSPFLDNFPGVTLAGTFCGGEIGRCGSSSYTRLSEEQSSVRCCLHVYSAVYLVMSYALSKGN